MSDSPEQEHLRGLVTADIEEVFKRHNVGGIALLISTEAAAWVTIHPKWSGLQYDHEMAVPRLRLSSKDPEGEKKANSTIFFIQSLAELCSEYGRFWTRYFQEAVRALQTSGATVHLGHGEGVNPSPNPLGEMIDAMTLVDAADPRLKRKKP